MKLVFPFIALVFFTNSAAVSSQEEIGNGMRSYLRAQPPARGNAEERAADAYQTAAFTCADAQRSILSLPADAISSLAVSTADYTDQKAFVNSKPAVDASRAKVAVTTRSFIAPATDAAPYEQLWCKLKSHDAVAAALKTADTTADVVPCASVNERLLLDTKQRLFPELSDSLSDLGVTFLPDQECLTGSQWVSSQATVSRTNTAKCVWFALQASRLQTATWVPIVGGMHYCKLVSPNGAEKLLREAVEREYPKLSSELSDLKAGSPEVNYM